MRGKQWPKSKQTEVLEAYALSESLAATSSQTGVPKSTVARWVKQNCEKVESLKKRNQEIAERAIEESLEDRMRDIADFGKELRQKARDLLPKVKRATPSGLASLGRAAVQIELRGLGEPTESIELRGRLLDEAIERELARLATAGEEGASNDSSESS